MKSQIIFAILLLLINTNNTAALSPDSCDIFEGIKCGASLTSAINECKESKDISKCYNQLSENKQCIHCTCSIFPHYCSVKSGQIDENGPTNPFSKVKINEKDTHYIDIRKILLTAVQCEPSLFEPCQEKIKKIGAQCLLDDSNNSLFDCLKDQIAQTECNSCLCRVMPTMCDKEQLEKVEKEKKKQTSSPNISDILLGGLIQSGLSSQNVKNMFKEGANKSSVTNLLQNKEVQNKFQELMKNELIKDSLRNLIFSNPEQVSKVAQNIADSKEAINAVQDITASHIQQEKERQEKEKKQKHEEEKKQQMLECNHSMKKKCQFEFIKLLKQCPSTNSGQKACVYTQLSGRECEYMLRNRLNNSQN